jgi:translation machinery-associated protein 16
MHSFVHQHDEEFSDLKKERRAGRPPSTREDLLRMKIAADEKEYENGFCEDLRNALQSMLLIIYRSP